MIPVSVSLAAVLSAIPTSSGVYSAQFDRILGTSLELKIVAQSFELASRAEATVLAEFKRLQQILGSFEEEQEFYQWNNKAITHVSNELKEVLEAFSTWQYATNGVINPASEVLTKLWQVGTPDAPTLAKAVEEINQPLWEIRGDEFIKRTDTDMRLHTFAKGYVMEKVAALALQQAGVHGIVLNVGGDILVKGDWVERVAIVDPFASAENAPNIASLQVANKSIATSGDYRRGTHIMDPRTGLPATEIASATVIHADAVTAGALATALNVLSVDESKALTAQYPGTEYFIVDKEGNEFVSENWSGTNLRSDHSAISFVQMKEKLWNANQELAIQLRLADLGGGARRPYVAVWIEDEKGKPVRRLALWYRKPRWLPDLREFASAQRADAFDMASVASATRGAGDYSLVWDGKNDAGQFVVQGNYTVMIEAAREHGTYQLMKQSMKFDGKVKSGSLAGNDEISGASLTYRTK